MANEKALNAREISSIIKACRSAGVKELRFGDLHITFGTDLEALSSGPITIPSDSQIIGSLKPGPVTYLSPQEQPQEANQDDIDLLLAVTDPVEWERRQLEEETHG